jgi:hypothetical protein
MAGVVFRTKMQKYNGKIGNLLEEMWAIKLAARSRGVKRITTY